MTDDEDRFVIPGRLPVVLEDFHPTLFVVVHVVLVGVRTVVAALRPVELLTSYGPPAAGPALAAGPAARPVQELSWPPVRSDPHAQEPTWPPVQSGPPPPPGRPWRFDHEGRSYTLAGPVPAELEGLVLVHDEYSREYWFQRHRVVARHCPACDTVTAWSSYTEDLRFPELLRCTVCEGTDSRTEPPAGSQAMTCEELVARVFGVPGDPT